MERKHELSEVARSRSGSWNDLSQSSTSATSKRCIQIRWRPLTPYFVCTVDSVGKVYLQTATECHLPDGWVRLYPTKLPVDAVHAMNHDVLDPDAPHYRATHASAASATAQ